MSHFGVYVCALVAVEGCCAVGLSTECAGSEHHQGRVRRVVGIQHRNIIFA